MAHAERVSRSDLRRDVRFVTAFRATLRDNGELRSVIIGDISAGGALIKGKLLPAVGTKIQLIARALLIRGRVMWRREGLAGVRFDTPVNPLHVVRENSDYFNSYRERRERRGIIMSQRCGAIIST